MKGYGFSIWLVPTNLKYLQKTYNMKHIPHVTVETNLIELPDYSFDDTQYNLINFRSFAKFEKQYTHDPLEAWGWICDVPDISISHIPHMSLIYTKEFTFNTTIYPPDDTLGQLYYADTTSECPANWSLLFNESQNFHSHI